MIGAWMAYSVVVGLLLFRVASVAEGALRLLGWPIRWVWAVAMAGTLIVPFALASAGTEAGWMGSGANGTGYLPDPEIGASLRMVTPEAAAPLDILLVAGWGVASAVLALGLVRSALLLRRISGGWRTTKVEGSWVEISHRTGPAVVGVLAPRVVLPDWVLSLDRRALRLLLAHEREHQRAGDPRLLILGMLAAVAVPWNPGLWLQLRRLRHAVEIDCDTRVVAWNGQRRAYAELLLLVAERGVRVLTPTGALSYAASPPLERRIRCIAGEREDRGFPLLAAGIALLLLLAIAAIPSPSPPSISTLLASTFRVAPPEAVLEGPSTVSYAQPQMMNRHAAPEILGRVYPPALRDAGIGGTVVLWAEIRPEGRIDEATILESSGHPELDEAARMAIREFRYHPGRIGGMPSATWAQLPVTFVPGRTYATDLAEADPGARVAIWRTPVPAAGIVLR